MKYVLISAEGGKGITRGEAMSEERLEPGKFRVTKGNRSISTVSDATERSRRKRRKALEDSFEVEIRSSSSVVQKHMSGRDRLHLDSS